MGKKMVLKGTHNQCEKKMYEIAPREKRSKVRKAIDEATPRIYEIHPTNAHLYNRVTKEAYRLTGVGKPTATLRKIE